MRCQIPPPSRLSQLLGIEMHALKSDINLVVLINVKIVYKIDNYDQILIKKICFPKIIKIVINSHHADSIVDLNYHV